MAESSNTRGGGFSSEYRGVRKRKWGKWVSEIREPGTKKRIWLGSFETPEMAAAAFDAATFYFRGHSAQLNFPELAQSLPRPASSAAEDVRLAAQEASFLMKKPVGEEGVDGSGPNHGPVTVGLSPSQIQAINESPMEIWTEFDDTLMVEEGVYLSHENVEMDGWDEVVDDRLWDP